MRRALIVGIDGYEVSPLNSCVKDAEEVHRVLDTHQGKEDKTGDPNFDCLLYVVPNNDEENREDTSNKENTSSERTRINSKFLKKKIHKLFSNKAEMALFYFSGHGEETPYGAYLVPEDASKFDEGIPMAELLRMANQSLANEVVIILDCCFSGSLGNHSFGNYTSIREGVSILTSSSDYQKSFESKGMGAFTKKIVEALDGEAADVIGRVHVGSLYSYTEKMFSSWEQRPLFKGHLSSMTTIRQCNPRVDVEILRRLSTYFKEEDSTYGLYPSYEHTFEGSQKEHVIIFQELQKCVSAGLVIPHEVEHMYDAAMKSKSCKLTTLGKYYWKLAKTNRI